jgi:hypothetical protein
LPRIDDVVVHDKPVEDDSVEPGRSVAARSQPNPDVKLLCQRDQGRNAAPAMETNRTCANVPSAL